MTGFAKTTTGPGGGSSSQPRAIESSQGLRYHVINVGAFLYSLLKVAFFSFVCCHLLLLLLSLLLIPNSLRNPNSSTSNSGKPLPHPKLPRFSGWLRAAPGPVLPSCRPGAEPCMGGGQRTWGAGAGSHHWPRCSGVQAAGPPTAGPGVVVASPALAPAPGGWTCNRPCSSNSQEVRRQREPPPTASGGGGGICR